MCEFNRFFICEVHPGAIEFFFLGGEGVGTHFAQGNFSLFFSVCLPRKWMKKNIMLMWKFGGLCLYICLWFQKEQQFYPRKKIQGKLKRNKYKTRIKTLNCLLLKSRSLIVAFYWNKYVLVVNLVVSVECGILDTNKKKTWEGYHRMPHKDSGFDSFLGL